MDDIISTESTNIEASTYNKRLNKPLKFFFMYALRSILRNPLQAFFFFNTYKTIRWQHQATRIRLNWEEQGIHVPPIIVFSITHRCPYKCIGCYSQGQSRSTDKEMSDRKIRSIFEEARDLGISFIAFSGGEPFIREEILEITNGFPEFIYIIFTNGLLINDETLKELQRQKNVIPLISLEGYREDTDGRRGEGVYERLQQVMKTMKKRGIFFGASFTLTRRNFDTLTSFPFIHSLLDVGCKFFIFFEYMSFEKGTEDWLVSKTQRAQILNKMYSFATQCPALFTAIPGDEGELGGCLAAGRGIVHINADGYVEPCPFVPYSDANLNDVSLKDALQSRFLKAIRENQHMHGTEKGCPLWVKREWMDTLLQKNKQEKSKGEYYEGS